MQYTEEDCVPAQQDAFGKRFKEHYPKYYRYLKHKSFPSSDHPSKQAPTLKRKPEREVDQPLNSEPPNKRKKGRKARPQAVFQVPLYLKPLKIPLKPSVQA